MQAVALVCQPVDQHDPGLGTQSLELLDVVRMLFGQEHRRVHLVIARHGVHPISDVRSFSSSRVRSPDRLPRTSQRRRRVR